MMREPIRKEMVDEGRAAFLLGLPREQLRQICEMSGLGHQDPRTSDAQLVFTYEELYKLCRIVVGPVS